jgi:hypothetical protein
MKIHHLNTAANGCVIALKLKRLYLQPKFNHGKAIRQVSGIVCKISSGREAHRFNYRSVNKQTQAPNYKRIKGIRRIFFEAPYALYTF